MKLREALPENATYERDLGPNEVWITPTRQYLVTKGTRDVLNAAAMTIEYRGFTIESQHFARPFLVERADGPGAYVHDGFILVKDHCNLSPGAAWYLTVDEAKKGADILLDGGPDGCWGAWAWQTRGSASPAMRLRALAVERATLTANLTDALRDAVKMLDIPGDHMIAAGSAAFVVARARRAIAASERAKRDDDFRPTTDVVEEMRP